MTMPCSPDLATEIANGVPDAVAYADRALLALPRLETLPVAPWVGEMVNLRDHLFVWTGAEWVDAGVFLPAIAAGTGR